MGRCSDARDRLLHTAARLIHERGYTAVSVADICDAAGLKKGSFYHFFPSKLELVLETLDRYSAQYGEILDRALDPALSAREQIGRMFGLLSDALFSNFRTCGVMRGCPLGNLALEMADRDPQIREKIEQIFGQWRTRFERVIRVGVERGEIPRVDAGRVAEAFVATAQGAILLAKTFNDPRMFDRIVDAAYGLLEPNPPARGSTQSAEA
jgi:TetR/AcrR family transcriptional repressor of nem operon